MLINDKSRLKRNVKQIGFQLARETGESLSLEVSNPQKCFKIVLVAYVSDFVSVSFTVKLWPPFLHVLLIVDLSRLK